MISSVQFGSGRKETEDVLTASQKWVLVSVLTRTRWYAPLTMEDASDLEPLNRLMETLRERARTRPPNSYTTRLMDGGPAKIGKKILEESAELIEAAEEPGEAGRQHFVYEAGDLIYHTMVLLAWRGVELHEVAAELQRREGVSGLEEKRRRTAEPNGE